MSYWFIVHKDLLGSYSLEPQFVEGGICVGEWETVDWKSFKFCLIQSFIHNRYIWSICQVPQTEEVGL